VDLVDPQTTRVVAVVVALEQSVPMPCLELVELVEMEPHPLSQVARLYMRPVVGVEPITVEHLE
jgi:hypothetical protein